MSYQVRCSEQTSETIKDVSPLFPWARIPLVVRDDVPKDVVQLWDNDRLVVEIPVKE
jgi:hypothetical protein